MDFNSYLNKPTNPYTFNINQTLDNLFKDNITHKFKRESKSIKELTAYTIELEIEIYNLLKQVEFNKFEILKLKQTLIDKDSEIIESKLGRKNNNNNINNNNFYNEEDAVKYNDTHNDHYTQNETTSKTPIKNSYKSNSKTDNNRTSKSKNSKSPNQSQYQSHNQSSLRSTFTTFRKNIALAMVKDNEIINKSMMKVNNDESNQSVFLDMLLDRNENFTQQIGKYVYLI